MSAMRRDDWSCAARVSAASRPWVGGLSLTASAMPVVRGDLRGDLVAVAGEGERVDHLVGDEVAEVRRRSPARNASMTRCCCLGEAVELEEVGVGAHGGVEADAARRRGGAASAGSASTEQQAETTSVDVGARRALGRGRARPRCSGRIRSAQVARRAQLVADPAVADLAGEPGHRRAHRGQVDRDLGALHRVGALVAADPHRLVLALEVDRLAGGAASATKCADVADGLAQVGDRLAPLGVVPVLVEPLHAGAEAEDEPAAGQLVEVERLERGDHRAAGERERDGGADPAVLVPAASGGGGDGGAAVQLRAPRRPRRRPPRPGGTTSASSASVSPQGAKVIRIAARSLSRRAVSGPSWPRGRCPRAARRPRL